MTDARATQALAQTVEAVDTPATATQLVTMVVHNYPSENVPAFQAFSQVTGTADDEVTVYQAFAMVVVRGIPDWPVCRVWTYTLDGHDYLLLNTVNETLVCDLSIDPPSWYVWGTGSDPRWRGWLGRQWVAKLPNEESFGSNVLVGDRVNGTLYFLNPEGAADDNADFSTENQVPFKRVITGQVILRGRTSIPCFGVEMTGSPPQVTNPLLSSVELFVSDDRGANYVSCGAIDVTENDYDQRFDWLSLGSMNSPGRLFQIVDYGALTRVDDLAVPDAESR